MSGCCWMKEFNFYDLNVEDFKKIYLFFLYTVSYPCAPPILRYFFKYMHISNGI